MGLKEKWWAILGGYEKIVLQFSREAREFFPELLDTWEPPKTNSSDRISTLENTFEDQ